MTPGYLQTTWARLLVEGLVAAGVTDLVISPGSRSTPFVLAAGDQPRLRRHVCIDERAAAFFALGHARVTGTPCALLCTSGTAPAHYFPAVIEASQARVPLLVLSADRPLDLVGCAAPQTIDQVGLFGAHVRSYVDLDRPDPTDAALDAARRRVAQAVWASMWPEPGPVHVNLRARKPLEAVGPASDEDRAWLARVTRRAMVPPSRPRSGRVLPDAALVTELAAALSAKARGLIVAGPAGLSQAQCRDAVVALHRATGWPLLAEATSQLRFGLPADVVVIDAFDHVLAEGAPAEPEVLVQIGAPPIAGGWEPWLSTLRCRRVVVAPWGWNDPPGTATDLVLAEVGPTLAALAASVRGADRPAREAWAARWRAANTQAWARVARVRGPVEGTLLRAAFEALPAGGVVMLGNSLSVRLVDHFVPADARDVPVLSQRGASGIDGLIAGGAGAATALGRPVLLVLGDVSAIHDLNGLLLAPQEAPLAVLILDNGGGRIFELLPIGRANVRPDVLAHFTTPRQFDFDAAARAFGVRYERVAQETDVARAVARACAMPGCTLVHAVVPPHGASEAMSAIRGR